MAKTRSWLLAILLLAVLLRAGVAVYLGDTVPAGKDEQSYSELAARLATGHGYSFDRPWYPFAPADAPTAHWSFLYTAFVAAIYRAVGPHPLAVRLLQAVLAGLLLPWLTYRLARRAGVGTLERWHVGASERVNVSTCERVNGSLVPLLAAFLAAIYAYFVLYGAMVQTEAFYICALLWSLERGLNLAEMLRRAAAQRDPPAPNVILSDRRERRISPLITGSLTLGLSLGIATLLRQSILPWVVVLFAWLLWDNLRTFKRLNAATLASLALAGLVMLLCILPFTLRNYRAYGDFLLLNSNAGYAMYSAQHPMHGTSFQEYAAAPLPADLVGQGLNEAGWDKALMARGIGFVLAEPGRYFMLSLSRVRDYFEFWPTADSSLIFNLGRVLSFGLFLPFMLYGLYLEVKAKVKAKEGYFSTSALTLTLTFVLFYSLLHIFTWAMSRYRLPVDAVLLIYAAVAMAKLVERANVGTLTRQ
jgi:hypothetical protein